MRESALNDEAIPRNTQEGFNSALPSGRQVGVIGQHQRDYFVSRYALPPRNDRLGRDRCNDKEFEHTLRL
jgi:hypothetical protein